jgi:hypothetical protein
VGFAKKIMIALAREQKVAKDYIHRLRGLIVQVAEAVISPPLS